MTIHLQMNLYLAKKDRKCIHCNCTIPIGTEYFGYKEKVLSYREAAYNGSYKVQRHVCKDYANGIVMGKNMFENENRRY